MLNYSQLIVGLKTNKRGKRLPPKYLPALESVRPNEKLKQRFSSSEKNGYGSERPIRGAGFGA